MACSPGFPLSFTEYHAVSSRGFTAHPDQASCPSAPPLCLKRGHENRRLTPSDSLEGPEVRFLLGFGLRLGFLLLAAHLEETETALLLAPQVRAVGAAPGPLHVRDLRLTLHAVGIHGEQVLPPRLLPVREGP